MLCEACKSFDIDKATELDPATRYWNSTYVFYENPKELVDSARAGCELCQLVVSKDRKWFQTHYWVGTNLYDELTRIYCKYEQATGVASFRTVIGSLDIKLRVYAEPNIPGSEFITKGTPLEESAASDRCLSLLKHWMADCHDSHGSDCYHIRPDDVSMPTRLIDVGVEGKSDPPRLVVGLSSSEEWVALSHVWGSQQTYVTNTDNLPSRTQAIRLEDFDVPQTFKDAITVTRLLGFRYLWIDSLCILQDSYEDWVVEARRMGEYYKYGSLTLFADTAEGDREGFLSTKRKCNGIAPVKVPIRTKRSLSPILCFIGPQIDPSLDKTLAIDPLHRRGWTLQEWILSTRTLHFSSSGLLWQCGKCSFHETVNHRIDLNTEFRTPFLPSMTKEWKKSYFYNEMNFWYKIVREYQSRAFTKPQDRLPAIAGLAAEFAQNFGQGNGSSFYKAGLWMNDIHSDLIWSVNGLGCKIQSLEYVGPTWSWISLDTPKRLEHPQAYHGWSGSFDDQAVVKSCEVTLVDGDPFGRISAAHIVIQGMTLPTAAWRGKSKPHINIEKSLEDVDGVKKLAFSNVISHNHYLRTELERMVYLPDRLILSYDRLDQAGAPLPGDDGPDQILLQIYMGDGHGPYRPDITAPTSSVMLSLVLMPVNGGAYRRVGVAEVPIIDDLFHEGWEIKEVTIV